MTGPITSVNVFNAYFISKPYRALTSSPEDSAEICNAPPAQPPLIAPFLCGVPDDPEHPIPDRKTFLSSFRENGLTLRAAPAEFKNDKELVLAAVKENGLALQFASEELKNDKEIVLAALKTNVWSFGHASLNLRNDRDFVLEAVKINGFALSKVPNDLLNDREIVLAAVQSDGDSFVYASDRLKNDKEIILNAIEHPGFTARTDIFKAVPDSHRKDGEIISAMVKYRAAEIGSLPEAFRHNKTIALAAVSNDGDALSDLPTALRDSKEIVLAAVKQDGGNLKYASKRLRSDPDFQNLCFAASPLSIKFMINPSQRLRGACAEIRHQLDGLNLSHYQRLSKLNLQEIRTLIKTRENFIPNEHKPLALIAYAKEFSGNVADNNRIGELMRKGYQVVVYEAATDRELYRAIEAIGRKQTIDLLVIGGHGNQTKLCLNSIEGKEEETRKQSEEYFLDTEDRKEIEALSLQKYLNKNSILILESCATGKGGKDENNLANMLAAVFPWTTVLAPSNKLGYVHHYVYQDNKAIGVSYGNVATYAARISPPPITSSPR